MLAKQFCVNDTPVIAVVVLFTSPLTFVLPKFGRLTKLDWFLKQLFAYHQTHVGRVIVVNFGFWPLAVISL